MPNNSLEIMINASSIQEKDSDLFYDLSGIYLILIGIIGGIFNLIALIKATKVSISSFCNRLILIPNNN